jgi:cardiolipin synthase
LAAFFQLMADSVIQVLEFNPINPLAARKVWELNQRDHRKLLIDNRRTAFMGGINISRVYSGGSFSQGSRAARSSGSAGWRDADLQLQGSGGLDWTRTFGVIARKAVQSSLPSLKVSR